MMDLTFLHYRYSTWISLNCLGRYKTYDKPMRRWGVATGIVSSSNFHFLSTAHYWQWISNVQQLWGKTRTPPMRPSCSVREEQALCSKTHLVLRSSTLRLIEPIPSYQRHKAPQHLACVPSAPVHIHPTLKLQIFRRLHTKKPTSL